MELQPNPLSAMEMIAKEPIRVVHGRKAVCDGGTLDFYSDYLTSNISYHIGAGPLGHPKIFINLVCRPLSFRTFRLLKKPRRTSQVLSLAGMLLHYA